MLSISSRDVSFNILFSVGLTKHLEQKFRGKRVNNNLGAILLSKLIRSFGKYLQFVITKIPRIVTT